MRIRLVPSFIAEKKTYEKALFRADILPPGQQKTEAQALADSLKVNLLNKL